MKQYTMEGMTPLSQDELLKVQGGGLLAGVATQLTPGLSSVFSQLRYLWAGIGNFLGTTVDMLV